MRRSSHPRDPHLGPIRVLIVAPVHMIGGQAHAARDIAHGFAGDDAVRVSIQAIDPRLRGHLSFLTELKILRSIFRPLLYVRQLLRVASETDVMHVFGAAHTAFLFGAAPAIAVARVFRRPVLLNYHDGRAPLHFRYWGPVLRGILRKVDALVLPSGFLQQEFARHGFAGEVVPNVVDTAAFPYRGIRPHPPRLISLRSLERLYGIENTIRAFGILKTDHPELVLDIYGGGPEEGALRDLANRMSLRDITFHGTIEHSRMPEVLSRGGIVVNSSRIDNQPLFVLEAFASGVPVVSTAAGGIPWMIRHEENGLLVPLDDPEALAAQVRRLLERPELAMSLVRAARSSAEAYSWEAVRNRWVEQYERLR